MARKPIGEAPLTGAERTRRHRAKKSAERKRTLFQRMAEEITQLRAELRKLKYPGEGVHPAQMRAHLEREDKKRVDKYVAEFEAVEETPEARKARILASIDPGRVHALWQSR